MWMLTALASIVTFCAYIALTINFSYWRKRRVPHPPFSKLFGNVGEALIFKKSIGQIYHEIYNKYSSAQYVGFYKIRTPAILIRDPEFIKEIIFKNFPSFHENDVVVDEKIGHLMAKNPFFSTGEQWKTSRGQLTPSFTNKQMKANFPLMETVCQKLITFLEDPTVANSGIEVKELCQKFTMDVVANCVVGLEGNSFTSSNTDFMNNVKKIISPNLWISIKMMIAFVMPSLVKYLKIRFVPESAGNYFIAIVNKTIEYRRKNSIVRQDFLNTMLELQLKLGKIELSNDVITAHTLSFFLDGFETSSIVLSFALYDLGKNIICQDKLREEIEYVLNRNDGKLNYDSVQEMAYLNKILNETLRMHPPAMFMLRRCTKTFQMPCVNDAEGVIIEPGTPVIIPIYSLHYDPKYYPNPERFDPERFVDGTDNAKCIFLPFGGGPRACIGQRFAITQIKAAIVHLILNFDIRVNNKTRSPLEIDPTYFLLAAKGGIWINFIKRNKSY